MNRRSFLKYTVGTVAAAVVPLPSLADKAAKALTCPFINLLQSRSPQLTKVAGAKAGMLMNAMTKEVFNSIEFVPCFTQHVYVEWKNNPVATHAWDSDIVKAAKVAGTPWHLTTPTNNRLVETYYLYGLMVRGDKVVTPCVLSFSTAKIKAYKNLMQILHSWTPSMNGLLMKHTPPMFAYRLRISTILTIFESKKRKTSFYNYRINPAKGSWKFCWDSRSVDVTNTLLHPDSTVFRAAQEFNSQMRKTL